MSVTPLASRQTTLTFCIVCKNHAQIPQELPTEHCDHRPEVCLECLQQTVEAALSEGRNVLCPTLQCRQQLSHSNLKHWATPDVFDQEDRRLLRICLGKNHQFVNCINPHCNNGQLHPEGEKEPIVKCHACGTRQCFVHHVYWHESKTCKQFEQEARATHRNWNRMSRLHIQTKTKRCPNCRAQIEKVEGCDRMRCRCKFEFCYSCLAPYDSIRRYGNHHHKRLCRYWRPREESPKPRWWEFWRSGYFRRARWQ